MDILTLRRTRVAPGMRKGQNCLHLDTVPKGTPPEIVKTLREAAVEAINSPEVLPRLATEGAEPVGNTPEEFGDFMKKESVRWAEVIKKAGIGLD